jgi:hypothetical protein
VILFCPSYFGGARECCAAAVGVEDHSWRRDAGRDPVGQGISDQLSAQVAGHGVADDPPRGDVDHGSHVQPPFRGTDDLRERQRMRMPEIAREMTRRWISEVPSKIV